MVHRDRTRYNIGDLTIAAYNVTKDVLTTLHHLVSSDNDKVCISSARALAALKHPSSQGPVLDAFDLKPGLIKELITLAAEFKTEEMLNRLYDRLGSAENPDVKSLLIGSIGSFQMPTAIQALSHYATHDTDEVRIAVAKALGKQLQAKEEAETLLQSLLNDRNRDVVTQALVSLRLVGSTNIVSKIEETLEEHQDAFVRSAALSALGALSSGASVEVIKKYLDDSDTRVRASAVESLGLHLKEMPEMLRELMPFLKDESNRVIANAIIALYPYARDESADALSKLIASPLKYHRASAAYCIGELQYPDVMNRVLPLINTEPEKEVFDRAVNAIGRISKSSLKPFLHKLSTHPNNDLRRTVVKRLAVISTIDDSRFFNDLFQKEHVPAVKAEIIRAIGGITDENSFSILLEYLNDANNELVLAALDAIGCTGRESTIPLISPLLKSKSDDIRLGAIDCLFRLGVTDVMDNLVAELGKLDANGIIKAAEVSQKLFHTISNLKEENPERLMAKLQEHFLGLQSSDIELEKKKLTQPVLSGGEKQRDHSQTTEVQFAELLSKILPLAQGGNSQPLSQYARQHPRDILSNYLDIVFNQGIEASKVSDDLTRAFKTEKFMPGLFASLETLKKSGDRNKIIEHSLEMASSQIRIMLEFVNRALTYVKKDDDYKAGKMLDFLFHYLKLSPDIHAMFGAFYLTQKDYDLALDHLFKAYVRDPRNYDLLLKIAGAAVRQGKYSLAESITNVVKTKTAPETDICKRACGLLSVIAKIKEGIEPVAKKAQQGNAPSEPQQRTPISLTQSQETAIIELSDEDMLFEDM